MASDAVVPVYSKLGYEAMDRIPASGEGGEARTSTAMIWWPPGTKEQAKKPALPDYGAEAK